MADEQVIPAASSDAPVQEPVVVAPAPDLVTRVSEVKPPAEPITDGFDKATHDAAIAALPPEAQLQVKAYESSVMSGANKKFMEAADIKKELAQPWTTDRVQQLLNDQSFVSSAQEIATKQALAQNPQGSGMQDTEWSALTDGERKQFYAIQQNQSQMQAQMNTMLARQEDQNLMTRYKNYDATKVDQLQRDLMNGKVSATREALHKVIDYDDAVQRAYQYAKQDNQTDIQGKVNASTVAAGVTTTPADTIPEKPKGMSNIEHFKNLAMNRIKQFNEQSGKK